MSDSIYICAASLCCTLVICSIIRIVSPSGSTQKIMSVVISVFTLCSLISPFYELVKNINLNTENMNINSDMSTEFVEDYDSKVVEVTAEYINAYVDTLLKSYDVKNSRIETLLSFDDSKGIYIKEMNIYLYKSEDVNLKEIGELIYSSVGVKPIITEL